MKQNNLTLIYVGIIILAFASLIVVSNIKETPYEGIKQFTSTQEIKDYLQSRQSESQYYRGGPIYALASMESLSKVSAPAADDYSTTNIQVAGVDEGDFVKTDGNYIYTVSGNNVFIVDANPSNARILSNISMNGIKEIYIKSNKLVLIGQSDSYPIYNKMIAMDIAYYRQGGSFVQIYDVSDRNNPKIIQNITTEGSYLNSRMIGDKVYFITQQYAYYDSLPEISNVYYFDDYSDSYTFTTISSVNINTKETENKTYLIGSASEMYVSKDNIYITYQKQISGREYNKLYINTIIKTIASPELNAQLEKTNNSVDVINTWMNGLTDEERNRVQSQENQNKFYELIQKETDKTIIHRISIKNDIVYAARGEMPGHVLNQFSMDEYNGYFRAATTTGQIWGGTSRNHVYVMNSDLIVIGKVEDLAPGETIYSARFMGDRAYVVTFKKIDPLFVLDLSIPENPKLMGKLKIPGYSDYLHPYDENHLIGIGKDAVDAEDELTQQRNLDFAWYQGVKISLFDVTDIEKPKEISNLIIGDRGSDSYALHDHKAFLFSKDRNLLVIPVLKAVIDKEKYTSIASSTYGDYVDQGAYVFDISLDGIKLRGSVGHGIDFDKTGYYYDSLLSVKRSLYIGNNLYTISDSMIKINDLVTLKDVNKVLIPIEKIDYPILYY